MRRMTLCLLLAGCATPGFWQRPGSTFEEFSAEKAQCMSQAYSSVPQSMMAIGGSPGVASTSCTGFGNTVNCYTNPGVPVQPVMVDANTNARTELFRSCMQGKGWVWRTK